MAKKICELCGTNTSSDILFGVPLCDRCRSTCYDIPALEALMNDSAFIKNATPRAKQLAMDKIKAARGRAYAEEKAREQKEREQREALERERREQEERRLQQAY